MKTNKYDIIIIGSGMGGLVCGDILSREGYSVCIIEKNKQIGGCLQTYVRDKHIFDSGVHYLGGLSKGQNLYQIFKYLNIIDKLKLEKYDNGIFDKISFDHDEKEYVYTEGYEEFIAGLLADFPDEEKALRTYCDTIKKLCSIFPMYNLESGDDYSDNPLLEMDTKAFIESITDNKKLQMVLAGNNFLYAGQADKTPLFVHALVLNSYILSSWKCVDGGSQIGKYMAQNIRENKGVILRDTEVKKIVEEDGKVTHVELADGAKLFGDTFISNLHPAITMKITVTDMIKNAYKNRLNNLENSISSFMINIILKKNTFKNFKNNYYCFKEGEVWSMADYTEENWPLGYAVFLSAHSGENKYAKSLTILTYMKYADVLPWADTHNTVSKVNSRGESYEAFKKRKAETLLDSVEKKFPALRNCIEAYYTATPLSYRDYIGTTDGSMYGIVKDYKNLKKSFIETRTKIPNLFLTGQNLNLHGILGAAISALVTCKAVLGNNTVIEKIKNA